MYSSSSDMQGIEKQDQFTVLKKCRTKFDC